MVRRISWSRRYRASAGFTLVELLVVISIIAMLMALLLPAVQSARESGRRNTCQNNQHNLSLALMSYNDTKKNYPGWNNWLSAAAANSSNIGSGTYQYAEVTYIVPLLPYLEQNPVYLNYVTYLNNILTNGTTSNTAGTNELNALSNSQVYMANLVCPSNPPISTAGATPLAYTINGGQLDSASTSLPITQSFTPYGLTVTGSQIQGVAAASGIAYDQTAFTNNSSVPAVRVSQDYVNAHDGTSYTLLLSENTTQGSSWSVLTNANAGGTTGTPGVNAAYVGAINSSSSVKSPYGQQVLTTFMWVNGGSSAAGSTTPPSGYFTINGDKTNTTAQDVAHARPASNHNGVCVFAFCGGNVRPIAEDIDYRVYKQLMTPFGGSSISPLAATSISGSGDLDSYTTVLSDASY